MVKSPAAESGLWHARVLRDDRHHSVGAKDLRLGSRLLEEERQEGRDVRYQARQLRVLQETAEAKDSGRGIRVGAGKVVCAAPARDAGKTHLDDGRRRADRLISRRQ